VSIKQSSKQQTGVVLGIVLFYRTHRGLHLFIWQNTSFVIVFAKEEERKSLRDFQKDNFL
jgi:hypothetical protein